MKQPDSGHNRNCLWKYCRAELRHHWRSGTSQINADITTTGEQTYGGAVTLGADVELTAKMVLLTVQ